MSYVLQFFIAAIATVTFAILFAAPKELKSFAEIIRKKITRKEWHLFTPI